MARGEDANKVSRIVNDGMMKWVDAHPDKFVGLGTVPLQELDIALDTLDYIKKETNLKGLQILTNVNGMEISDDSLDKFWAKATPIRFFSWEEIWKLLLYQCNWQPIRYYSRLTLYNF